MIDLFRCPEPGFRAPDPIRDLIAAINDKARAAQTGLFTMMAVGIYIIATSFSTTDLDLLMEKSTPIAQLGVQVPVVVSFAIAPIVLFCLHVFTLVRYHLLSLDLLAFNNELDVQIPDPQDQARCRSLLANTEFVHLMSVRSTGQPRTALLTALFWAMVGVMPVLALLIVEIGALRLQEAPLTNIQRLVIILDLTLLFCFAARWRPPRDRSSDWPARLWRWSLREKTPAERAWLVDQVTYWLRLFPALARETTNAISSARIPPLIRRLRRWAGQAITPVLPAAAPAVAAYVVIFIAVYAVPPGPNDQTVLIGRLARDDQTQPAGSWLYRLVRQPLDLYFCPSLDWGCRYLSVEHRLIVAQIWDKSAIIKLRTAKNPAKYLASIDGIYLVRRHLRFADFSGSRMYGAKMARVRMEGALLFHASMQGADLEVASMQGADLDGASIQGAHLGNASLEGAFLADASMQDAHFEEASMQGAHLERAAMQGTYLEHASMQGADLEYASMQGADLFHASMQGAALEYASMQGTNLEYASMNGANLEHAAMQGSDLKHTAMQGADLENARFYGVTGIPNVSWANAVGVDTTTPISVSTLNKLLQQTYRIHDAQFRAKVQKRLNAAANPGASKPEFAANPRSVLVRNDVEDAGIIDRADTTTVLASYSGDLAVFLAEHVAPESAASAAGIADYRAIGTPLEQWLRRSLPRMDRARTGRIDYLIGCRLLEGVRSDKISLAGYPRVLVELKRTFPRSKCKLVVTQSATAPATPKSSDIAAGQAPN